MNPRARSNLGFGVILILLGVWFLLTQLFPGLMSWAEGRETWPLLIVAVGVMLLILGGLTGVPSMAIPASIVGGIGGLLYWQTATGNWASWAYAWALIPGFVGIGTILMGLMGQDSRRSITGGLWLVVISLVLFGIFSSFLGGPSFLGAYWPVLLIGLGLLILFRSFYPGR